MMFTEIKPQPEYPCLDKVGRFILPKINKIVETDFEKLKTSYNGSLANNRFGLAFAYAQQASIYHGVPGLLLYLSAKITQLSRLAVDEEITQEAFNTYAYLLFTEKLMEHQKDSISEQPDINIASLKTQLIKIATINHLQTQAETEANNLLAECVTTLESRTKFGNENR